MIFTKIFSIKPTGIPDLPGIPVGYLVSNPFGGCPEKGGTAGIPAGILGGYPAGIPAGIPVGYFQRGADITSSTIPCVTSW